jgi:hypothetical protein
MGARSSPGAGETIHGAAAALGPGERCQASLVRIRSLGVVPLAVLLALGSVAGCGGDEPTTPPGASSTSNSTGASGTTGADADADGATDAPPFPADLSADIEGPPPGALVTVRDIRIGRHDGFDRVVFEVGGRGTPGWDVRYVDDPSSQGSGDPVEVSGEAVLQVTLNGVGYPDDTGIAEYSGPDPLSVADTEVVTEVAFDATFEGTTVAFIGTTSMTPFRVYRLADPGRVVVEVADPS